METQTIRNERIDIRITLEEKKVFLRALKLSGDRSLSAFVTRILKAKAVEIIDENEQILSSKRDRMIFFDAIFNEMEPNNALKVAAKKFKSLKE